MEDVDIRYENGVIYMIKHKTDDTKEFYIGSSFEFKARCRKHKTVCNNENSTKYNYKLYQYIRENGNWNEWDIILLYDYPCKNKYQLELEEQRAIKGYKSTLNTQVPCRTQQERYKDNKEKILQQNKEYRKNNKEKIKQKDKERYENNKEKYSQKNNERYKNNKEEINKKRAIKINCDICGCESTKCNLPRHKRTQKCINYFKKN